MVKKGAAKEEGSLDATLKQVERAGGVAVSGDAVLPARRFSTGSLGLDIALGGGWARGSLILLGGQSNTGKTTLCLHACRSILSSDSDGDVVFIDSEGRITNERLRMLRLDADTLKRLKIVRLPMLDHIVWLTRQVVSQGCTLVVVDGIASAATAAELLAQADITKPASTPMAVTARVITDWVRSLIPQLILSETTIICTTQVRTKMASGFAYEDVYAPYALRHAAGIVLWLRLEKEDKKAIERTLPSAMDMERISSPVHRVIADVRKSHYGGYSARVPLRFFTVDIPSADIRAGEIDVVGEVLTWGVLPCVEVLREEKRGNITVFCYGDKTFTRRQAYTDPVTKRFLLDEVLPIVREKAIGAWERIAEACGGKAQEE